MTRILYRTSLITACFAIAVGIGFLMGMA